MAQDGLRDLRPAFLAEKQTEVGEAISALDGGRLETVRLLAHRLKGEGANFGFREVTELGAALVVAVEGWDTKTVRATLQSSMCF
jgi:HPt (histidine-containing phosphotransfer) domain-containing protein